MRRLALASVLVVVASVLVTSTALAQRPGGGGIQPLCITGCGGGGSGPSEVAVTPYGASDNITVSNPPANATVTFTVRNIGTQYTDTYTLTMSCDGSETCVSQSQGSATLAHGASVNVTVTFTPGAAGTTGHVYLMADDGRGFSDQGWYNVTSLSPGAPTIVAHNLNSDNQDRGLCLTVGAGQAAGLSCGNLFVAHAMPAYRTMGRDRSVTLFYSSATAAPRPAVAVWITEPSTIGTPTSVFARLQVSNVTRDSATYASFGAATKQIVLAYDARNDASGIYPFTILVRNQYAGGPYDATLSGEVLVVNRSSSELGAGWGLAGVEQLVTGQSNSRILWIGGDGSAAVYNQVNGTTWVRASGEYRDTIVLVSGQYTRTLRHGIKVMYDGSGHHVQTSSKAHPGQVTTFTWSGSPTRLSAIQVPPSAIGASYSLVWNGTTHLLDSIVDPPGRSLRSTMSSGTLTQLRDPDGRTVGFQYDGSSRLIGRTTPRNYTSTYSYANNLRVTRVAIPLNPAVTDSARDSSRTTFEWWDEKGLAINSPGGTLTATDTANSYSRVYGPRVNVADNATFWVDRWGAPLRIVGAINDTTFIARDSARGWITMVRNPIGDSVTATYTARGNDSTVTDQTHEGGGSVSPVTTSYVYGDAQVPDGPTQTRTPVDTTTIQYNDSLGVPQLITRQGGGRTGFSFDLATGLMTAITEYGARVVDTTAWTRGFANLTKTLTYDAAGNDTSVTTPSGRRSRAVRDVYRRIVQMFDPAGHETDHRYDLMNRDTAVTVWDGGTSFTTRYRFTADGVVDTVLDPRNVQRLWYFDAANRDTANTDEAGVAERRFFNAAGLLDSARTRTGHVIRFRYDESGRQVAATFPTFVNHFAGTLPQSASLDSTIAADSIVRTFDAAGRLLTAKRSDATITRSYNREGTVRSERQQVWTSAGGSLTSDYTLTYWTDAGDRRTKFFNGVDTLRYSYGADGRLAQLAVQWIGTGLSLDTFQFYWDSLGRRDSLVYRAINTHVSYGYDVDGRPRMLCSRHPGTSYANDEYSHQYIVTQLNPDGLPLAWHESYGGSQSGTACAQALQNLVIDTGLQYNGRHMLVRNGAGATSTYSYDASGNRTARHWVSGNILRDSLVYPSQGNRVSKFLGDGNGGTGLTMSYLYDANGSTNSDSAAFNAGYTLFYMDALGETRGLMQYNGAQWVGFARRCRYDALGRRVVACAGGGWLVFDGDNPVGNSGVMRYVHGPATDDPLVTMEWIGGTNPYRKFYYLTNGGGRQYAFADPTGTDETALWDYSNGGLNQAGAIAASETFENARASSPEAIELSFYRNRYYDQSTGRWTQEDPIGLGGGVNLYGFAGNNPVAFTDPYGTSIFGDFFGAILGFAGIVAGELLSGGTLTAALLGAGEATAATAAGSAAAAGVESLATGQSFASAFRRDFNFSEGFLGIGAVAGAASGGVVTAGGKNVLQGYVTSTTRIGFGGALTLGSGAVVSGIDQYVNVEGILSHELGHTIQFIALSGFGNPWRPYLAFGALGLASELGVLPQPGGWWEDMASLLGRGGRCSACFSR